MLVYRISASQFIGDLSGMGSYLNAGRWNRKGRFMLYAADCLALSAWEVFVNMPEKVPISKHRYSYAILRVPDLPLKTDIILPPSWPARSDELLEITDAWLNENEFLCMRVPSAVVPHQHNYLINVMHPAYDQVDIVEMNPFPFDVRASNKTII